MIPPEEIFFQHTPALRIPMQGHHIGEVIGSDPNMPELPINDVNVVLGCVTWIEKTPHMGVAVNEGKRFSLAETRPSIAVPEARQ